jgi:hypothetical protein
MTHEERVLAYESLSKVKVGDYIPVRFSLLSLGKVIAEKVIQMEVNLLEENLYRYIVVSANNLAVKVLYNDELYEFLGQDRDRLGNTQWIGVRGREYDGFYAQLVINKPDL